MRPLALALALALAFPLVAAQEAEDWNYQLRFDCPAAPPVPIGRPACPLRIELPGETLGAPSVALDPTDTRNIAVAALAGRLAADGRAREGETHALFLSTDGGQSFARSPLPSPAAGARGLDAIAAASPDGGLFVAALHEAAGGTVVSAWKMAAFGDAPGKATTFASEGGSQSRLSLVVLPENGTVAVSWHEEPSGVRVATSPLDAAATWSLASEGAPACSGLSNAVGQSGAVWLACVNAEAHPARSIEPGDLTLLAFHVENATFEVRNEIPAKGEPTLAPAGEGRLALAALERESEDEIHLRVTTWSPRGFWSIPLDPGLRLHAPTDPPAADARVLAMTHRPGPDGFDRLHIVYAEWPAGTQDATAPRMTKWLVATTIRGNLLYRGDLGVDAFRPTTTAPALGALPTSPSARAALPDDLRDGLAVVGMREAVAFGDAGTIVFGELAEEWNVPVSSPPPETPPVEPASATASVIQLPPPKFTLAFEIGAAVLATGVVLRILAGRITMRSASAPPPATAQKEEKP